MYKPVRVRDKDKEKVGKLIVEAATDSKAAAALKADPEKYFGDAVEFNGHEVIPRFNTENTMNLMIPHGNYVVDPEDYVRPKGYEPWHVRYDEGNEERSYYYRVGDYVFAQCG